MRTFTVMFPGDEGGEASKRPRRAISNSTYIYTQLSMRGGGSPPFYWSPGVSFLMLDNWIQTELDEFASFHGVAAVVSLQLTDEEAGAIIALADSRTVRYASQKPAAI